MLGVEAVLGSEEADVSPKVAVVETHLEVVPGDAPELDAKNWEVAVVVLVFVLHPTKSQEKTQAAEKNSYGHLPPELPLAEAVAEIQAPEESMFVVLLGWCWQESPVGQEGERAQGQVQGLALVLEQE